MKHSVIFLAFWAVAILTSCTKDESADDSNNMNTAATVQQGKWKVTLYNDSGTDETYHFTGYEFTFSNGTLTAVKGSTTVSGTYSTGTDDTTPKLVLYLGESDPWEELNDDWHVLEKSTTKIRLQDVSGGGSGTDLLTFEKI